MKRGASFSAGIRGPLLASDTGRPAALLRLVHATLVLLEGGLALTVGYLLFLLCAARGIRAATPPDAPAERGLSFVVLIPAHDEQRDITATLDSLAGCRYPSELVRTVVIADNCSDRTADFARDAGAEVWERHDPARIGKGAALIWALARLESDRTAFHALVILDADCRVGPNLLGVIDARLRAGASAVQARYEVENPAASTAAALRFAGFALMNTVRPMGKQRLGLSCGLFGTGMAFTRELLAAVPWTVTGLLEDAEYHMRLVDEGYSVEFAPEAWVSSAMPTSLGLSSDQHARWEKGKSDLVRRWTPQLVGSGLAQRDIVKIHAGLEQLVPPQSLIAAGSGAAAIAGWCLGSRRALLLSLTALLAQLSFVVAGLQLVRAPRQVYLALVGTPMLVLSKGKIYLRSLMGRGPTSWVRTTRS